MAGFFIVGKRDNLTTLIPEKRGEITRETVVQVPSLVETLAEIGDKHKKLEKRHLYLGYTLPISRMGRPVGVK